MVTLLLILFTSKQIFVLTWWFFPLKHAPYVNASKGNNQSAAAHKVIVHNSVNSFVASEPVSVVSRNFIRPDFTSKHVCNIPSKTVKGKVACELVFNVSRKSMKSKVACKPVCDFPSNTVKSKVSCKTLIPVNFSNPVCFVDVPMPIRLVNYNKIVLFVNSNKRVNSRLVRPINSNRSVRLVNVCYVNANKSVNLCLLFIFVNLYVSLNLINQYILLMSVNLYFLLV